MCVCLWKKANVLLTLLNLHPLSSFPMTFGNMVISSSSRFRPILLRNLADHRRVATKFLKESYACIMVVRCNDSNELQQKFPALVFFTLSVNGGFAIARSVRLIYKNNTVKQTLFTLYQATEGIRSSLVSYGFTLQAFWNTWARRPFLRLSQSFSLDLVKIGQSCPLWPLAPE